MNVGNVTSATVGTFNFSSLSFSCNIDTAFTAKSQLFNWSPHR